MVGSATTLELWCSSWGPSINDVGNLEGGAKISQNCRRIVLKNCRYGEGGCQKSGKIADVVYGCSSCTYLPYPQGTFTIALVWRARNATGLSEPGWGGCTCGPGWGGVNKALPDFGRSVNPISARGGRGADYAQHITTVHPPDFQTFLPHCNALLYNRFVL